MNHVLSAVFEIVRVKNGLLKSRRKLIWYSLLLGKYCWVLDVDKPYIFCNGQSRRQVTLTRLRIRYDCPIGTRCSVRGKLNSYLHCKIFRAPVYLFNILPVTLLHKNCFLSICSETSISGLCEFYYNFIIDTGLLLNE